MLTTSPEFTTATTQGSRTSQALVSFGVYDVTAKSDASPVASNSQPFTSLSSLLDNIKVPNFKFATLEDDMFKLDGSFYLMPDDASLADLLAWWSTAISDASGNFTVNPVLTITFSNLHSSFGIGLFFDPLTGEHCTAFDIVWYNGATVLSTQSITGNTLVAYTLLNSVSNYNKIVITFKSTSKPYRYAKLMEVDFGVYQVFDSNSIVEASVTEEVDPISNTVSINTLTVKILNTDQQFNMINPTGLFAFLQKNQVLEANSGLLLPSGLYEWVMLGTFFLSDWKNSTDLTTTLKATDVIGLLDKTSYTTSAFWTNASLNTVITSILNDAASLNSSVSFPFIIDSSLASEVVNGYLPIMSHREALQCVLIAARASLVVNRNGVIKLTRTDYSTPLVTVGNDLIMSATPAIEQKAYITSVQAKAYAYALGASAQLDSVTMTYTGSTVVKIPYKGASANVSASITGSGSITASTFSATQATITVTGSGTFTIILTGQPYIETSSDITTSLVPIPAGQVPQTAILGDNKLIVGNARASSVTAYLLAYYGRRIKQTFECFNNPALQAGDCVNVQTMFGGNQSGVIEHQTIRFAPGLTAGFEVTG